MLCLQISIKRKPLCTAPVFYGALAVVAAAAAEYFMLPYCSGVVQNDNNTAREDPTRVFLKKCKIRSPIAVFSLRSNKAIAQHNFHSSAILLKYRPCTGFCRLDYLNLKVVKMLEKPRV